MEHIIFETPQSYENTFRPKKEGAQAVPTLNDTTPLYNFELSEVPIQILRGKTLPLNVHET